MTDVIRVRSAAVTVSGTGVPLPSRGGSYRRCVARPATAPRSGTARPSPRRLGAVILARRILALRDQHSENEFQRAARETLVRAMEEGRSHDTAQIAWRALARSAGREGFSSKVRDATANKIVEAIEPIDVAEVLEDGSR